MVVHIFVFALCAAAALVAGAYVVVGILLLEAWTVRRGHAVNSKICRAEDAARLAAVRRKAL